MAICVGAGAGLGLVLYQRAQRPGLVALDEAWSAVRRHPHHAGAWGALGDAQSAVDQLAAAEESYRTALRLEPEAPELAARLGFLLYGKGEDAGALQLLERAQRGGAQLPMLNFVVLQLRAQADATSENEAQAPSDEVGGSEPGASAQGGLPPASRGAAAIDTTRFPCELALQELSTFRVPVALNGATLPLIFDTGASITTISRRSLEDLGIPIREHEQLNAITAAGSATFPTAVVEQVEVAGRVIDQLRVAVCQDCGGQSAGGLLGLDVQAAVGMELDLRRKRVRFLDCE